MNRRRLSPGDAARLFDLMVMVGYNPSTWQYNLLQRIENADVAETFNDMTRRII